MSSNRVLAVLAAFFVMMGFTTKGSANWAAEPDSLCAPALTWGYLPQYYGNCDSCDGMFDRLLFRADFLYWKATEDGLDLGTEEDLTVIYNTPTDEDTGISFINDCSRQSKLDFDYDPSFRVGFMFLLPCDGWDISANWTYFRTKASATGCGFIPSDFPSTPEAVTFISNWERFDFLLAGCSEGRWNLNLNVVDLELGRTFFISPSLAARPFIGLRYASVDQTYQVESASDQIIDDIQEFASETKAVSKFAGLGVRAGFEVDFKIGWGFSFVGLAGASLVYGEVQSHAKEFAEATLIIDDEDTEDLLGEFHSKNNYHRTRTILDLAFGLKWDNCFDMCGKYHPIGIAVLWEHHAFYRMNDFEFERISTDFLPVAATSGSHYRDGDLTTGGLTVSFFVGF